MQGKGHSVYIRIFRGTERGEEKKIINIIFYPFTRRELRTILPTLLQLYGDDAQSLL